MPASTPDPLSRKAAATSTAPSSCQLTLAQSGPPRSGDGHSETWASLRRALSTMPSRVETLTRSPGVAARIATTASTTCRVSSVSRPDSSRGCTCTMNAPAATASEAARASSSGVCGTVRCWAAGAVAVEAGLDHRGAPLCEHGVAADEPVAPPLLPVGWRREVGECLRVGHGTSRRQQSARRAPRRRRDVALEEADRAEAARVVERRQRRGERHPGRDADARVERGRHDGGEAARLDDLERRATPPSGATLTTTTSAAPSRATRIGSSALRIDSSAAMSDVDPVARQGGSQLDELLDAGARLLGVLEVVCREPPQRLRGGLDVPPAVGVDPDARRRTHRGPDGGDPVDVVVERLAALGDLDLRRRAPVEAGEHLGHAIRADGRDGRVDGHGVAHGSRPHGIRGLERRRPASARTRGRRTRRTG